MKKAILFVDDEPMILAGLQRILREMRTEWDMSFANSGAEALAQMERAPVDVIVTDMKMPGMNGAQLLSEVMRRHPATTRFILSGFADRELTMQCAMAAHQFISKPCDATAIRTAVNRAFSGESWLQNENLRKIVLQMASLPSLPALYYEIMESLHSAGASVEEVGQLISKDIGITAKLLQLVNSAFFGLQRRVANPTEAVLQLGLETVKSLVVWAHVFSQHRLAQSQDFSIDRLSNHSLATGILAKELLEEEHVEQKLSDEAFTAGLLHDIGKLVLAANLPREYAAARKTARDSGISLEEAERLQFGASHAEVGAYLLSLWGLPTTIIDAAAYHNCPSSAGSQGLSPLLAIHVADILEYDAAGHDVGAPPEMDFDFLLTTELQPHVKVWQARIGATHSGSVA